MYTICWPGPSNHGSKYKCSSLSWPENILTHIQMLKTRPHNFVGPLVLSPHLYRTTRLLICLH